MTDRLDRLRLQLVATEMSRRVGGNIRRLREAAGLGTQRELADLLPPAVTNQHISNWERGVNQPSPRYLEQLAQALNADVSDFYAGEEENGDAKEETPDLFAGPDDISKRLDRIEQMLEEARSERQAIRKLLATQETILNEMRRVANGFPDDDSIEHLTEMMQDLADRAEADARARAEDASTRAGTRRRRAGER